MTKQRVDFVSWGQGTYKVPACAYTPNPLRLAWAVADAFARKNRCEVIDLIDLIDQYRLVLGKFNRGGGYRQHAEVFFRLVD